MQDDASTADAERHRRRKRFASMLSDAPDDLAKNLAALIPQTWKDTAEKEYAAELAKWEQEGEPLL